MSWMERFGKWKRNGKPAEERELLLPRSLAERESLRKAYAYLSKEDKAIVDGFLDKANVVPVRKRTAQEISAEVGQIFWRIGLLTRQREVLIPREIESLQKRADELDSETIRLQEEEAKKAKEETPAPPAPTEPEEGEKEPEAAAA